MRKATSRSGVSVVLKIIVDSNERRLLEYLSGIKASSNYSIPLLGAIELSIGKTIIVLPWKSPLDEVLRFHDRPADVVSLFVKSQETMTEGWCGTPPWIAPELGYRDGPTQRYNPILADRWVCGRMIEYFTQYFLPHEREHRKFLLEFAEQLLDDNPRARPELKLPAIHGPTKRKSARNENEPVPKRPAVCLLLNFVFGHRA